MAEAVKQVARNQKAYHDYFIEEKFEAGIELAGTEVKSIRMGNVNLKDSFCLIKDGQLSVLGMHISPYEKGNIFNKDPRRPRRLLMHKREIMRLFARIKQDGYSLIPLSVYFKGPRVKLSLGLARGKKLYDKQDLVGVVGHGGVVILQAAVLMQHGVLKGLLCDTGQKSVPSARLQMILNVNFQHNNTSCCYFCRRL